MADIQVSVKEMTDRLKKEGLRNSRFTWLLGAGFSYSAGIPLATSTAKRIAMFEYLLETKQKIKVNRKNTSSDTESDDGSPEFYLLEISNYRDSLFDFLKWFSENEINGSNPEFKRLMNDTEKWLIEQPGFKNLKLWGPNVYSSLFQKYLINPEISRLFISSLVGLGKGTNIAHCLLAYLLSNHPDNYHTVFTTNFDDLLLESLTMIGCPSRVFGDLNMVDKPEINPSYPQIVYLHGRHSSYALKNTGEQLSHPNLEFEISFREHIGNSSIIVIGYSAWDDLVTRVLSQWNEKPDLIRGNMYWVPFKSEKNLNTFARQIIESAPTGRAKILVDPANDLDSDMFIYRFCRGLDIDPSAAFNIVRRRAQNVQGHLDAQWDNIANVTAEEEIKRRNKGKKSKLSPISPIDYFEIVLPTMLRWKNDEAVQINSVVAFELFTGMVTVGEPYLRYTIFLRKPKPRVIRDSEKKADLKIQITMAEMQNIISGQFNAKKAILDGAIQLMGDLSLLKKVGILFQPNIN